MAAELVGAVAGLGTILNQAAQDIYPAMIVVSGIGEAMARALGLAGARVLLVSRREADSPARPARWLPTTSVPNGSRPTSPTRRPWPRPRRRRRAGSAAWTSS